MGPEHSTLAEVGPGAEVMPDVPATGNPGAPAQEPGTVLRRSPGMMLEDDGRAVREHGEQIRKASGKRGKLENLVPGSSTIAYSVSSSEKLLNVGLYVGSSEGGEDVDVHVYGVGTDNRMNVKWKPLYRNSDGVARFIGEDSSPPDGRVPHIERILVKNIIRTVGLSPKGQLYHRDSRELDNQGWRWRPPREAEVYASVSRLAYLVPGCPCG